MADPFRMIRVAAAVSLLIGCAAPAIQESSDESAGTSSASREIRERIPRMIDDGPAGGGGIDYCRGRVPRNVSIQPMLPTSNGGSEVVLYLEPGCYRGDLRLDDLNLTLVGAGASETILVGAGTSGAVVEIGGGTGSIRNLLINSPYPQDGIRVVGGTAAVRIRNTVITSVRSAIVADGGTFEVRNNTFVQNGGPVFSLTNGAQPEVHDNVVAYNLGRAFSPAEPASVGTNDFFANPYDGQIARGTNRFVEPRFADWTAFSLSPVSPILAAGSSGQQLGAYGTNSADVIPPSAPAFRMTSRTGDSSIELKWYPSSDDTSVNRYLVYRAPAADGPFTWIANVAESDPPPLLHSWTDLSASTDYWYRLIAVDKSYNVSAPATAVSPPSAPTPLTLHFQNLCPGNPKLDFNWAASIPNAGGSIQRYELVELDDKGVFQQRFNVTSTSFTLEKSCVGTFQYKVRALDTLGNFSGWSNTVMMPLGTAVAIEPAPDPPPPPIGDPLESVAPTGDDDDIEEVLLVRPRY